MPNNLDLYLSTLNNSTIQPDITVIRQIINEYRNQYVFYNVIHRPVFDNVIRRPVFDNVIRRPVFDNVIR